MIELMKSQIEATVGILHDTLGRFDEKSWKEGFAETDYPWRLALHTVQALERYFSPGDNQALSAWSSLNCWQTADDQAPSVADVQAYLAQVQGRIEQRLNADAGRNPAEKYDPGSKREFSVLELYVYALRHTMQHNGALATLADRAGADQIKWR